MITWNILFCLFFAHVTSMETTLWHASYLLIKATEGMPLFRHIISFRNQLNFVLKSALNFANIYLKSDDTYLSTSFAEKLFDNLFAVFDFQ